MKVVLQRVNHCTLTSGEFKSSINFGLLATVGVSKNDTIWDIKHLAKKIVNLRQFKDDNNKVNLSLLDVKGDIMLVSNFTLQANATRGTRPDFSHAGESEFAYNMYLKLVDEVKEYGLKTEIGNFGNHMHLACELDGPFTIILESEGREHE